MNQPKTKPALVDQWRIECSAAADAHYDAARYSERMHFFLGIASALFSAIVACGVVLTLDKSPSLWLRSVAILLSVFAVVFAAVQTFSNYSVRAAEHKSAGSRFDSLRRSCESKLTNGIQPNESISELESEFKNASDCAVAVPERFKKAIIASRQGG
ncbi:SLATT domain-containing protein [Rhodanobacter sp. C01]|uniref:SLATT domain-containing protein n=1 Tax=Rhodanobacter sp. C01 TaxID=1945856 RepID=UPI0011155812|nr:SLATT domain-containing protein [Rhodanobacter sp. C01]